MKNITIKYELALNASRTKYDWVETKARIVAAYKAAYAPLVKAGKMSLSSYAMTMSSSVNAELERAQKEVKRARAAARKEDK